MPRPDPASHSVQFYSEATSLFETVGSFLGQGFLDGHAAIIVATGRHTAGILDQLQERMIDVKRAQRLGRLVAFDAERMIDHVVVGETPDAAKLEQSFGAAITSMTAGLAGGARVRFYGEAVDLLWKQGRYDAAIRLEAIWNEVMITRYPVTTLCGYAMRNFLGETMRFDEVCRQHSHVMPARTAH